MMEVFIEILKFIWQDDVVFWGLLFIFGLCILFYNESYQNLEDTWTPFGD